MTESSPTLELEDVRKAYAKLVAVDGLSFRVEPGEFVGFIGPNGAGKSSTMRMISGILTPTSGHVRVKGHDVASAPVEVRKQVGYVPQDLELYRYLTGEELLRFVAEVRGVDPETTEARIVELLELTELDTARGRLIREYSGGMARKIAIASALIARPPLLLLDESFVGLDPESTYRLRAYLVRYAEEGGAILLSSHILDMLERMCSRIVIIHQGKLVGDLSHDELLQAFADGPHTDLTQLYLTRTGQEELIGAL